MVPSFDIFKMKSGYVLWCEAAETVEIAQERVQGLAVSSPGGYLIFNQQTGQQIPVKHFSSQVEHPTATEIPHHGGRSSAQHPASTL